MCVEGGDLTGWAGLQIFEGENGNITHVLSFQTNKYILCINCKTYLKSFLIGFKEF